MQAACVWITQARLSKRNQQQTAPMFNLEKAQKQGVTGLEQAHSRGERLEKPLQTQKILFPDLVQSFIKYNRLYIIMCTFL